MNSPLLSNNDFNSLYKLIDDSIINNLSHIGYVDNMLKCYTEYTFYLTDMFCFRYYMFWEDRKTYIDLFETFYHDWVVIYG